MFLNNRGVRIKRVEFRENVTGFFSQGQSKQSAIMMCPIKRVSVKRGLSVRILANNYCVDLSKAMESEINAFGTSCYRIMLNIKRIDRVSNAKIYDLTQTAPLVENVRTRQLRFLGHVLRMPDDEPCKEYALYFPPHGKRKPGRQRTLFLRYIQHLLGDTDNMIGPGKQSELAQDRCGWRKLVVACSAADRW